MPNTNNATAKILHIRKIALADTFLIVQRGIASASAAPKMMAVFKIRSPVNYIPLSMITHLLTKINAFRRKYLKIFFALAIDKKAASGCLCSRNEQIYKRWSAKKSIARLS